MVDEPPPDEMGTVPVHRLTTRPRLFGVTPPEALLVLGLVALGAAIVLFAVGAWVLGLILLVGAFALLAIFVGHARRLRNSALTAAAADASDSALAVSRLAVELVRVRGSAERGCCASSEMRFIERTTGRLKTYGRASTRSTNRSKGWRRRCRRS